MLFATCQSSRKASLSLTPKLLAMAPEVFVADGLAHFSLTSRKGKNADFSSLFYRVHEPKCCVEIRAGAKQTVVCPYSCGIGLHQLTRGEGDVRTAGIHPRHHATPSGNTTGHSVAELHRARVKSRSVSGST